MDFVKSLDDGVYETPDLNSHSDPMFHTSTPQNTKFWKVAVKNPGENVAIHLYVDGTEKYTETVTTTLTSTGVFFLVDVKGGSNSNGTTFSAAGKNLVYQIIDGADEVLLQGTVAIPS